MVIDIYIYPDGKKTSDGIRIPWLPADIKVETGGTRLVTHEIMNVGDVDIPNGTNLLKVSWSSTFPSKTRKGTIPFLRGSLKDPKTYVNKLESWRKNGTKLKVMVTNSPINYDVYIEKFTHNLSGGYGDITYEISLLQRREIVVKSVPRTSIPSSKSKIKTSSSSSSKTITYTIKKGDTLWAIAKKYLGAGSKWKTIYNQNKTIIEKTAKAKGKKSSANGKWIYPGTKIKITIGTDSTKKKYSGTFPKLPSRGYFKSGDRGTQVKYVQKFLNWYGKYGLSVDGAYGPKTIAATKKFQGAMGLKKDGLFGSKTLSKAKSVKK